MKRLICFFDGTWETADHPVYTSNIVKLKRAVPSKSADGIHQITYYSHGYALDGGPFMQYVGAAIGFGLDGEIRDTYRFLAQNYTPGDEIYIFGYSRGAFQARSLAGFVNLCGLLDPHNLHLLPRAWECYINSAGRDEDPGCADIRRAGDYPIDIQCLGVFDTVGNLGVPGGLLAGSFNRRFQFHNTGLQPSIKVALHALSIDEFRSAFRPSLWTHPKGSKLPDGQIVEQVWFPGTHGDVGGGFPDTSLADGALMWMAERVQNTSGLSLNNDHLAKTTSPNPLGPQYRVPGILYHFDRLVPFVRVVGGVDTAVSRMRRRFFRRWRIGRVSEAQVPINEDIHPSAIMRYGKSVALITGGKRRQIVYKPANLMAVVRRQAEEDRMERWDNAASAPIVLKRRQILEDALGEEAATEHMPSSPSAPPETTKTPPLAPAVSLNPAVSPNQGNMNGSAPSTAHPTSPAVHPDTQAEQPVKRISLGSGPVTADPDKPIDLSDDEKVA